MRLTLLGRPRLFLLTTFDFASTFAVPTTFVSLHSSAETSFLLDDSYIRFPLLGRSWLAGKATAAMESHAEMARAAARSPREDQALSLVFYWDSVPNPDAPPRICCRKYPDPVGRLMTTCSATCK